MQSQWPRWAGGGARARWDLGLQAGGESVEEGIGQERRGSPAAAAAAAAAKRPCCVVCGAEGGEEEEGVKPREETGERHHTHGTRWPERQQHPELSGVLTRPRSPLAGEELRPSGPQARGGEAAPAETRSAVCRGPISGQGRPERPGPRRRKRRCGIVRRGSPKPRRLDPARARGPARELSAGDLQVPAAALRPGNLQD